MNKGFTLAELLGVIVIISLLTILVAPPIINRIQNHTDKARELQNEIIYSAIDEYVYENDISGSATITIRNLIDSGKLSAPVMSADGKTNLNDYKVDIVAKDGIVTSYGEIKK